jgi:membrane protease subunit HflK
LTADFVRVIEAGVKRDTALTEARQYANETTNRALAEARARVNVAQAERKNLVELVAAEAKRFTDLLSEYRKDPQLFRELRFAEALQRLYTNVTERIIVQEPREGRPRQLWLQLGREPEKVRTYEPPKPQGHH